MSGDANDDNSMCRDFLSGTCKRKVCKFSHDPVRAAADDGKKFKPRQSRPEPLNQTITCSDFLRGRCFRKYCKYLHTGEGAAAAPNRSQYGDSNRDYGHGSGGYGGAEGYDAYQSYEEPSRGYGPPRGPAPGIKRYPPLIRRERSPMASGYGVHQRASINGECPNCLYFEDENVLLRRQIRDMRSQMDSLQQHNMGPPQPAKEIQPLVPIQSKYIPASATEVVHTATTTPYEAKHTNPYSAYNAYSDNYPAAKDLYH